MLQIKDSGSTPPGHMLECECTMGQFFRRPETGKALKPEKIPYGKFH